jgi:hypothetical protein
LITEQRKHADIESTLTGTKIQMGIDMSALAQIMQSMTDLYSNPILAVIREYSTNAFDANVEAGRPNDPVQVTLPGPLAPFLKIKDTGCGLSVEDIHKIYSQYGASTKRNTNEQVGSLGYGCKSALSYTNQFTVVSTKGGVTVTVAISRDEDGTGSMTIVDTSSMGLPDGTEVVIPVKRDDLYTFQETAESFFQWWSPGSVLIAGEQPKRFDGLRLADDLYIIEGQQPYVVMGNVAYPAERNRIGACGMGYNHSPVKFVNIGDVEFTPSREALRYDSNKTVTAVQAIRDEVERLLPGAIQKEIDAAPDKFAALKLMLKWNKITAYNQRLRGTQYTYGGKVLPRNISAPGQVRKNKTPYGMVDVYPEFRVTHVSTNHGRGAGSSQMHQSLPIASAANTIFVHGFKLKGFSASHKTKLRMYCEQNKIDLTDKQNFALSEDKVSDEWIPKENIIPWDKVSEIKLPRNTVQGSSGRIAGSYDVYINGIYKNGVPATDFDANDPVFYYSGGNRWSVSYRVELLKKWYPQHTVAILPENRVAKFERMFPQAKKLSVALNEKSQQWANTVPNIKRKALALRDSYSAWSTLDALKPLKDRFDDPALVAAIQLSQEDVSEISEMISKMSDAGCYPDLEIKDVPTDVLTPYALMRGVSDHDVSRRGSHYVLYANAVYSAGDNL